MKLLFLTGSRGEWGYIRPLLRLCQERSVEYDICVTNMHLLSRFGMSMREIEEDGFTISDKIYMTLDGYDHYAMAKSLGIFLPSFVDSLRRVKPDWIVLAGDRGEQLMGAIAGAYTYTPVAHIQAGELSGNIDGQARHAIGKFSHLHFASNEDAGQRLIKLGEEPFRVHVTGAPQLDELDQGRYTSLSDLNSRYEIAFDEPFLLVVFHPVTEEFSQAQEQVEALASALNRFEMPRVWILPNSDAGSETVRQAILSERKGKTHLFKNLTREDYLGILKCSSAIVGNSSSGLLEAPTFEVPAVNIGRRQADRVQGENVIPVPDFEADGIAQCIEHAVSDDFRKSLRGTVNPYGDGHSAERIMDILGRIPRDSRLLIKTLTY
jgi:GDP/UDP-N,N'-diacetylbacillosamine 2-epimerase (hydrolysing)